MSDIEKCIPVLTTEGATFFYAQWYTNSTHLCTCYQKWCHKLCKIDYEDKPFKFSWLAQQSSGLRVELDVLKAELERLRCLEETLQTRVVGKDKKIANLEDKVVDLKESRQRRSEIVSRRGHCIAARCKPV